jgi:hypothetical protein
LSGKRVEGCAQITLSFDSGTDGECDGTKSVPEFEAVVAFGRIVELREALCVLTPIEFARIDDDAANGGTMAWRNTLMSFFLALSSSSKHLPPIHFVAEWTTISAPWSMGRMK